MDEKSAMDTRYGRMSPLPLHKKRHVPSFSSPSDASRLRSRLLVYVTAIIFAFFLITYGLPFRPSSFFPQGSPENVESPSTHAKSHQTGLVPLEAHISKALFGFIPSCPRLLLSRETYCRSTLSMLLPRVVLLVMFPFSSRKWNADSNLY